VLLLVKTISRSCLESRDKSTNGRLSGHGGTVEVDEVKMSFCLKPIVDKSVLTRRHFPCNLPTK